LNRANGPYSYDRCGALGTFEILDLKSGHTAGPNLDLTCLAAKLHLYPEKIRKKSARL